MHRAFNAAISRLEARQRAHKLSEEKVSFADALAISLESIKSRHGEGRSPKEASEECDFLTPRWTKARLHPLQLGYLNSPTRFNVVAAGRRSFKTEAAKRRLIGKAIAYQDNPDGRFFACAPTHSQAHDIFWRDLQELTPKWALRGQSKRTGVSESKRTIYLGNGAEIKVVGLDRPQRIEGGWWDGGVITEFADVKPGVLDRHIKPMMLRGGWLDLEGVPEGRGAFFKLWESLEDAPDSWARHTWTTEETLHLYLGEEAAAAELAEAKRTMDPLVYRQEWCAEFISFEGLAYYAFDREHNLPPKGQDVHHEPNKPLIVCLDFNRAPGVAVYAQEMGPLALSWHSAGTQGSKTITGVIGEVWIPRASNTERVCDKIIADWGQIHKGEVHVYGDPAGGAKTSQGVKGSDWDIVTRKLTAAFGHRFKKRWGRSAPRVRVRVNAFNSRLCDAAGSRRLLISRRAKHLIDDLEGVEADEAGNLIKKPGPLTHLSDALGYYLEKKWPSGGRFFSVSS